MADFIVGNFVRFMNAQQQITVMIPALFFLHLINENKLYKINERINNFIYLPFGNVKKICGQVQKVGRFYL